MLGTLSTNLPSARVRISLCSKHLRRNVEMKMTGKYRVSVGTTTPYQPPYRHAYRRKLLPWWISSISNEMLLIAHSGRVTQGISPQPYGDHIAAVESFAGA